MNSAIYRKLQIQNIQKDHNKFKLSKQFILQMIKIDLQHNLSSLKIPQLRVDPNSTILALKQNIEKRYGSEPPYVRLTLKNKKGDIITQLEEDMRSLNFYGVQNGMIIYISDLNPNSIHKQIENTNQIQKYTISQQAYESLDKNFRKWKHNFLTQNPNLQSESGQIQICDPNYLKSVADTMSVGQRCQLQNGARGQIRYIGHVHQLGFGYFIGIQLDQFLVGCGNGTLQGMYYFFCENGKAIYQRPNKIQVGDFPKIEQSDQI